MSWLSKTLGINIDITKAVDNGALYVGKQIFELGLGQVESDGATFLTGLGFAPTFQGAAQYIVSLIEKQETGVLDDLPSAVATDIENAINTILSAVAKDVPSKTL